MPKNRNKTKKNREKFWSHNRFLTWKTLIYFNKVQNPYFSIYCQNSTETVNLNSNQTLFDRAYSNPTPVFFLFFLIKSKVFQWFSKSNFLNFMTKMNLNDGNETKLYFFHGTYSNQTSFFIGSKILNYFSGFSNWHFSV